MVLHPHSWFFVQCRQFLDGFAMQCHGDGTKALFNHNSGGSFLGTSGLLYSVMANMILTY